MLELRGPDLYPVHGDDGGGPEVPELRQAEWAGQGEPGAAVAGQGVRGWAGGCRALLVALPFAGLLLALAHGFVVGATVRWAARRRTHTWLGVAAAAAVLVGLGGLVLVLGGNPFAARLLLAYVLSGGVAFARASGAW